jgi:hypothetical protein
VLDRCFEFVLAFPRSVVAQLLDTRAVGKGSVVLDPFCGTGTTLVECKRRGVEAIGVDANPVCVMAAQVKTTWTVDSRSARRDLRRILKHARTRYRSFERARQRAHQQGKRLFTERWGPFLDLKEGRYLKESGLLSRGWISPRPALKCLLLIEAINTTKDARVRRLLLVSLLGLLVPTVSNVKYGPEIYCGRRRSDVDVFAAFETRVESLLDSISDHRKQYGNVKSSIFEGNVLNGGLERIRKESIDYVITSPPYPAEHDYTRMTRLELAFGGFVRDDSDLRELKRGMIPSSSKGCYVDRPYYNLVKRFTTVSHLRGRILSASRNKTHGFARVYPRLVGDYFGAMYEHFRVLKPYLKPGAVCAYIVGDQSSFFGIHIQTARILSSLLQSQELGYEVIGRHIMRTRRGTNERNARRIPETVIFFRKPALTPSRHHAGN